MLRPCVALSPPRLRGAAFMIGASLLFALLGTLVKIVAAAVPPTEIVVWRSVFTALFVLMIARGSWAALRPVNVPMHLVRGVVGVGSMMLYFTAISRLPLGDAVLLTYLSPLIVAALSPFTVGEHPSKRIWGALGVGIAGVALVVGPAGKEDGIGVLCGLGAAFFAASAYLSVKVLTRTDTATAIVFWFSVIGTLGGSLALLDGHAPVDGRLLSMLVTIGLLGAAAQWALTRAYASSDAASVSVYAYSTPVFAYLLGLAALGELPRVSSVLGAGAVLLAGVIAARE